MVRRQRLDQGMLIAGSGPVGRIDALAGGSSAKVASAIKTAHDSAMKKPRRHRLSVGSSSGVSSRRAPVAVRMLASEYRDGEKTSLPNTPLNIAPLDAPGNYLERWFHVPYASPKISDLHTPIGGDMHPSADSANPQRDNVYALWDRLAEFSAGDGDAALIHLLTTVCAMVAAQNALWAVVVRLPSPAPKDALLGWRPRLIRLLNPVPAVAASVQEQFDTLWSSDVDLSQILAVSGDEPFRTRLLFEALPPEWFEGEHYRRHYLEVGHGDSISVRCALNDDVRIHLFVFRDAQVPRFSALDSSLLGFAMRGLRWFYRQQLLSHGLLIANAPLTPAERKVLLGLLDGHMEKQIAQKLDQSPNTTHFHVKSIYAKFGVRNRSALAALWLGKLR